LHAHDLQVAAIMHELKVARFQVNAAIGGFLLAGKGITHQLGDVGLTARIES
jgi:hypothetical protein